MNAQEKRATRIALARDVLAKLDMRDIRPQFGTYFHRAVDNSRCDVCALGSLVVSCCGVDEGNVSLDEDEVIACLTPLFSVEELAVIEAAFEGWAGAPISVFHLSNKYEGELPEKLDRQLQKAARKYPGRRSTNGYAERPRYAGEVMRSIMRNIIRNKGEFRP